MTRIGLGLAALGRPGYLNLGHGADLGGRLDVEALEQRAHQVLDAAFAAGVRHFDAARSYGRAEAFLASWLAARGIAPAAVTVSSKWGYTYTADWQVDADPPEVKDLSLDNFRRQVEESRALLGRHLDLYQIHSATLESGVLDDDALIDAMAELKDEGIRIGLSTTGPNQAATIERALERRTFDAVQATWNPLEPSAGQALEAAHEAGLLVIVKEAVANGRLTDRGGNERLTATAERLDTTPDAVALQAALEQPWSSVVLSGAATVEHLASNLGATRVTLDGEAHVALAALAEDPEAYWTHRSGLAWN